MSTDFFDDDLGQRRTAIKGGAPDAMAAGKGDEMPARPISDLNLTRMARHREEVNTQVATARLQIERMKQQQSELEREKQMLEDLLGKQAQYEQGKQEMMDRLAESIVSLQKLGEHASRQVEIYWATRERFAAALDELQKINDSEWSDEAFRDELNKAVAQIDVIRSDFVKAQATVEAAGGPVRLFDEQRARPSDADEFAAEATRGFWHWLKIGLAATLPLITAIVVAVIVMVLKTR